MTDTKARKWFKITVWTNRFSGVAAFIPGLSRDWIARPMIEYAAYEALQKELDEINQYKRGGAMDFAGINETLRAELAELRAEVETLRPQRDQLHKILKEKNLAREIDDSRTPKGFERVEAYSNGTNFVILGEPDETHNCDQMGCGSLDHVIFRSSYLESERDKARDMVRELVNTLDYVGRYPAAANLWSEAIQKSLTKAQEFLKDSGGGE